MSKIFNVKMCHTDAESNAGAEDSTLIEIIQKNRQTELKHIAYFTLNTKCNLLSRTTGISCPMHFIFFSQCILKASRK